VLWQLSLGIFDRAYAHTTAGSSEEHTNAVPDLFTAEISIDGPISLKKLTRKAVHEMERKIILRVLQHHHWNRKAAARALNISYRALLYKIRNAGLPSRRNQPPAPEPTSTHVGLSE